jgi:hypothetical protein
MSEPDKTLAEFLAAKRISKSFYYGTLKKRGLAPTETVYPGSRVVRVSAAAERAFDERMAELAQSEAGQLEAARRREIAARAGKLSIKSPNHITRRRQMGGRARRVRG